MGTVDDNLKKVKAQIFAACERYGRDESEIILTGVSKTKPPDLIRQAVSAGLKHLGENKVQEAADKIPLIGTGPVWHMVGHLQTNKVKKAVALFDIIESVDSLKLAQALNAEGLKIGRQVKILLEVNSSGESSKYGLTPGEVMSFAETISQFEGLSLAGLMTVGPFTSDITCIDKAFALTYRLFEQMRGRFGDRIDTLSMGMSADFERAIKFGSTELRIGSAIFGARNAV